MKKLIFIFSILSIFILSSCKKPTNNDESSNFDTTTEVDDSDQGQEKEDEENPNDSTYDDNIPWGPLH